MSDHEFDTFAANYGEILDETIRFAGEGSAYFDEYKLRCLQQWCIAPDTTASILDFGCGTGSLAGLVARAFPQVAVHGYDVSGKSLEEARSQSVGLPNLTFLDKLTDKVFYDLIYSANVFHHVPPNLRPEVLRSLGQRLTPNGRIVIFEHNPWNPLTRYVVKLCPFDKGVTLISRCAFVKLARGVAMDVVHSRYIVFFSSSLRFLRKYEPRLGFLPLGAQYMLVLGNYREPSSA
jgi:SAM-dependent methyltransferase